MAVVLTVSETLGGAAVSDSLSGGGTGVDLGSCINGSFTPVTDQSLNQGEQTLYISHDGTNEVTDVGFFTQQFGTGTGFTYGGAKTAAQDFTDLTTLGNASGSSKNNGDGLSGGVWIDMDADSNDTTRFDQASFPTVVKIHGDGGTDGLSLATAFQLQTAAMVYDAPGETLASAPVTAQIGPSGSTTLGEAAKIKMRLMLTSSWPDGGIIQWEWAIKYSFTS